MSDTDSTRAKVIEHLIAASDEEIAAEDVSESTRLREDLDLLPDGVGPFLGDPFRDGGADHENGEQADEQCALHEDLLTTPPYRTACPALSEAVKCATKLAGPPRSP